MKTDAAVYLLYRHMLGGQSCLEQVVLEKGRYRQRLRSCVATPGTVPSMMPSQFQQKEPRTYRKGCRSLRSRSGIRSFQSSSTWASSRKSTERRSAPTVNVMQNGCKPRQKSQIAEF